MDLKRLYLDFNATSPLSQSVVNWLKSGEVLFANPASQHSSGKASRKVINETRAQIFSVFGKTEKSSHLFFHSGATEGMTTFACSFSEWARLSGKELLVCFSKTDHPAVTSLSERYFGPHVKFLELKLKQNLEYDHVSNFKVIQDKKDNNPELIILYHHLWVHNETGAVAPLDELAPFKTIQDLYLHIDAVQAPGKVPEWKELALGDIFTFSGHKFGALKGIGFSIFNKDISFTPLISGGGQQSGLRSGTENPQGVMSLALAIKDLLNVNVKKNILQRERLEKIIENELASFGEVIICARKNSNTIYFFLHDLSSDVALALFDLEGIELSAGSACSSGAARPSIVLTHMGLHKVAKNGLRLSFDFELSDELLLEIQKRFGMAIGRLKKSV